MKNRAILYLYQLISHSPSLLQWDCRACGVYSVIDDGVNMPNKSTFQSRSPGVTWRKEHHSMTDYYEVDSFLSLILPVIARRHPPISLKYIINTPHIDIIIEPLFEGCSVHFLLVYSVIRISFVILNSVPALVFHLLNIIFSLADDSQKYLTRYDHSNTMLITRHAAIRTLSVLCICCRTCSTSYTCCPPYLHLLYHSLYILCFIRVSKHFLYIFSV